MDKLIAVILNSIYSFVALFVIANMLGKKQVAQLTVVDYVVGISIGNIAGEWCTNNDKPWYAYLVGMFIFFVLTIVIDLLERKVPFKKLLKGKQIELVTNGKINYKNLKASKIDVNDLLGLCRIQGYFDLNNVAYVFFENNGQLSILPKSEYRQVVYKDVANSKPKRAKPAHYLIIDGQINLTTLSTLGKDEKWLFTKCNITSKKELRNIVLAQYLSSGKVSVHLKKQNTN